MTEKRNITKEDILLTARIRSEGVRIEERTPSEAANYHHVIALDGCDITFGLLFENPTSRLEAICDGEDVTISDGDDVLGTGKRKVRASWRDQLTSDGTTVQDVAFDVDIANILLHERCWHADTGKPCHYCPNSIPGAQSAYTRSDTTMSPSELAATKKRQVEAMVIALRNGWRGQILFGAGTPPLSLHDKLTDDMERFLTQVREAVGDEVLSENLISEIFFSPPEDLGILHRWKDIGLNSTEFDSEVVDPAYFKAICPAKGEKSRWNEAMFASAEVFGRGRGATSGIVMGIEPMAGLLERIEELVAGGVFPQLFSFIPVPGTIMGGMMPPSAAWFVEAAEKIADIYFKYADTFDVDLTEDTRFGSTRKGRSYWASPVDDEMCRRLQEMGKLGPGLPKQHGIEMA